MIWTPLNLAISELIHAILELIHANSYDFRISNIASNSSKSCQQIATDTGGKVSRWTVLRAIHNTPHLKSARLKPIHKLEIRHKAARMEFARRMALEPGNWDQVWNQQISISSLNFIRLFLDSRSSFPMRNGFVWTVLMAIVISGGIPGKKCLNSTQEISPAETAWFGAQYIQREPSPWLLYPTEWIA